MSKIKHIGVWFLALFITIAASIYQKTTGPTYPKKVNVEFSDASYSFKLIRTQEIGTPCNVDVDLNGDTEIEANIFYKRLGVKEGWTELKMEERTINEKAFFGKGPEKKVLTAVLPEQPEAGKIQYFIELVKNGEIHFIEKEKPVVIRFKGAVPLYILIPHIFFMFSAMLLASVAAIYFFLKDYDRVKNFGTRTFGALFFGGMVLGPIVQKFAFSEYWTGIPFGWDLTDNKTLIAFTASFIAVVVNWKANKRPILFLVATIVLYIIFTIPHSAFGSEFNYETGEVTQGLILPILGVF
jgi:hypothetical protein